MAKVLHLIYSLRTGGAERALVDICKHLPAPYVPVVCATRGGPYVRELEEAGIEVQTLAPAEVHPPWPRAALWIWHQVRQQKPALVHTHMYHANALGQFAAWAAGVPGIGHIQGVYDYYDDRESGFGRMVCPHTYRWLARGGRCRYLAVGQGLSTEFTRHTGVKADVVYNAANVATFDRVANTGVLRQLLGLEQGQPLVGHVHRLAEHKDPDCFLRAARRILDRRPEVQFVMVGDGPLRAEVERLRSQLGLEARVHMLGERHDVPVLMHDFDVFAFPTKWEGLPLVACEAMACRKPVVGTNVIGLNEVVVHGETGYLVPLGDHEALAERILELLENPDLARRMGEAGRQRVLEHFTIERQIAGIVRVYEEQLSRFGG